MVGPISPDTTQVFLGCSSSCCVQTSAHTWHFGHFSAAAIHTHVPREYLCHWVLTQAGPLLTLRVGAEELARHLRQNQWLQINLLKGGQGPNQVQEAVFAGTSEGLVRGKTGVWAKLGRQGCRQSTS